LVGGGIGDLVDGCAAQADSFTELGLEDLGDVVQGPTPMRGSHGVGREFVALLAEDGSDAPDEVPLKVLASAPILGAALPLGRAVDNDAIS